MLSAAAVEPIPLSTDTNGLIRVAGTRVTLDTVIDTFMTGASPEEIAQDFPVLHLDDLYAVITYYPRHRAEVDAYLRERRARAEGIPAGRSRPIPLRLACVPSSSPGLYSSQPEEFEAQIRFLPF